MTIAEKVPRYNLFVMKYEELCCLQAYLFRILTNKVVSKIDMYYFIKIVRVERVNSRSEY